MKSMLKSLMSVAAAALAFTSCSNDATEDVMPNGGSKTLVVNATIDQTRTVMADDHVKLNWSTDDQINLYIGATATEANSINPLTGGKITNVTYEDGKTVVYAYYSLPYDGEESTSAKNALININQKQTQTKENAFAGQNLPMVAKGTITGGQVNLVFKPVGCVLVFNVYGQGKTGEKITSIKFETSKGCYGYDYCDLTAENLVYEAFSSGKDATVSLTNYATVGAEKPSNTKKGENQVYLVVAPAEYPAGSKFTVTTDAEKNNTYTFTTTTALDCSQKSACVVNLNLAKSAELKPVIIAPTDPIENSSSKQDDLSITGIQFKNIEDVNNVEVGAFSDPELTSHLANSWITFVGNGELSTGTLRYNLALNDGAERTAYIGIKYGDAKAAIAVKQLAKGKFVTTYVPANLNYTDQTEVTTPADLDNGNVTLIFDKGGHTLFPKYWASELRCYKGNTITVTSSASNILKIEIVRGNTNSSKVSVNGSDLTKNDNTFTWTGESDNVVLNFSIDRFDLKSMKIYYGEDNEQKIIVSTTVDQQPAAGGDFAISGISFKNIDDVANVTADVYSDAELTKQENVDWLTITNSDLANGTLSCNAAANEGAERTAYIGIKYGTTVKAAIAITQVASGSTPTSTIEMSAAEIIANGTTTIKLKKTDYTGQDVNDASTYYKWQKDEVNFGGVRICIGTGDYADLIQMQGNASDKARQGFFGNVDDLKKITKVVIVSKYTSTPTENLYVGTSAYPLKDNGVAVTRADQQQDGQIYTDTFNVSGDYGFFTVANDTKSPVYVQSVTIYYSAE